MLFSFFADNSECEEYRSTYLSGPASLPGPVFTIFTSWFYFLMSYWQKKSVVQWKSCGNSVPKFWVNFNWELFKQQFWASILIMTIIKLPWKQSSPSSHTAKAKTKALQAKKAELKGIHSQKKRCAHLPLSSTPTPRGSKKAQIPSKWAQEKQVWSLCHH